MLRVLKVGGQARVLEFSQVKADWFRPLYDFHSFQVLPRLGKLFAQDADSYQYLAESIRKHPPQDELKAMMEAAGFDRCDSRNLSGGLVAIHPGHRTQFAVPALKALPFKGRVGDRTRTRLNSSHQ